MPKSMTEALLETNPIDREKPEEKEKNDRMRELASKETSLTPQEIQEALKFLLTDKVQPPAP